MPHTPWPLARLLGSLTLTLLAVVSAVAQPQAAVRLFVQADAASVAPGGRGVLAVTLDHDEGYHSWPAAHVELPADLAAFAIRTEITVAAVEGVRFEPVRWPEPHVSHVPPLGPDAPTEALTYSGRATAYVPFTVDAGAAPGERTFRVTVGLQTCNDQVCLPPDELTGEVALTLAAGTAAAARRDGDFAGFDAAQPAPSPPAPIPSAPTPAAPAAPIGSPEATATPDAAAVPGATDGARASLLGLSFSASGPLGLLLLALAGIAGGAVLNLTPCVLPVLPIKVLTLSRHAGESRVRGLVLGLAMAAGVVAFWTALGVPAAIFSGFADPSRVFGFWFVTIPLGVVMVVMSLGLMGLFTINLPQSVYMVNPQADSPGGSFLFGVMTAVLGLPCFGFVVGALLPAAATQGPAAVMVIFASLGVGMALPYLVLSAYPKLVERVPRTGPASELVKQVLGLILIGFGLFFFGTGVRALVATHPYTAASLHIYGLCLSLLAAAGWLVWRTVEITKKPALRGTFGLLGAALALGAAWIAVGDTASKRDEYLREQAAIAQAEASGGSMALIPGIWNDYRPALLERALAEGKTVFLDFTADWCINCKFLEGTVLNQPPVRPRLEGADVVMMRVDLTGKNTEGNALLKDLGRVGIPTWAVAGPGQAEPRAMETYTPAAVLEALDAAGGPTTRVSTAGAGQAG